jgi:hypothetical protein
MYFRVGPWCLFASDDTMLWVSPHYAVSLNLLWEVEQWTGSPSGPERKQAYLYVYHVQYTAWQSPVKWGRKSTQFPKFNWPQKAVPYTSQTAGHYTFCSSVKIKVTPWQAYAGTQTRQKYSSNPFATSALGVGGWSASHPSCLILGWDPVYRMLNGPMVHSGWAWKLLPHTWIQSLDHLAHSELLYQPHYPICCTFVYSTVLV